MNKSIPVWVFLLFALVGILGMVAFGWAVKHTLQGGKRLGALGDTAVSVANFPSLVPQVLQQLRNDASGASQDISFVAPREVDDLSDFVPFAAGSDAALPGLLYKASGTEQRGWRVLFGAMSLDDAVVNAAVVVSPDMEIMRTIVVDEIAVGNEEPRPAERKFGHGLEVFDDGSIVFAFDGGISLQRFSACGERVWSVPGNYHHAVTRIDDEDVVWTFRTLTDITKVSTTDGSILQEFSIYDVIEANPEIDILEIRRVHKTGLGSNRRNTQGRWEWDPFHFNDVDPLPAALADQFPQFDAGDLVLSARSLNLVFVVDPETLKIKWWRFGDIQRQHDPDWTADGKISVYNNRMSRDFSEIVVVDPQSRERSIVLDGRDHAFYSRIRGKHEWLPGGHLSLTSPQQGRAFEVNSGGEVVLEIYNTKPGSPDTNYTMSEIKWFPEDHFDAENWDCSS